MFKPEVYTAPSPFTQDEFNNMLIDIWNSGKNIIGNPYQSFEMKDEQLVVTESPFAGQPVTVTLTKESHSK